MDGKVVIVTGAAGGIGQAAARTLADAGARLVLVDRDEAALAEVVSSVGGDGVLACAADVTDSTAVAGYVREAVDTFGRLDALFNNAGIEGEVATVADADEATFDLVMAINVKGLWLNMKHAIRAMQAAGNGGSIINMSSGLGHTGLPTLGAYVGSKHAVIGLTRTAALEVGPEGIRVNAICPGPVATRMMTSLEEQGMPEDPAGAHELYTQAVPLGRYGRPEEVAELVLFLASDRSSFINGAAIAIDGGSTAD